MLSPNLASIVCYLCSLMRELVILCWNPWQLFQVSETPLFWSKLGSPISQTYALFANNRKCNGWERINNGFGTKIEIENIQLFWNNLLASLVDTYCSSYQEKNLAPLAIYFTASCNMCIRLDTGYICLFMFCALHGLRYLIWQSLQSRCWTDCIMNGIR